MDVFLHLGAHRTASTLFQRHLASQREDLADQGIAVWLPQQLRSQEFLQDLDGRDLAPWRRRVAALDAAGARGLILSEENLLGTMGRNLSHQVFYPRADQRFVALRRLFEGHRLILGLALRDYAPYWDSAYAFAAQRGAVDAPVAQAHLAQQPRRWRDLVTAMTRAMPEAAVKVWTYESWGARPSATLRRFTGLAFPQAEPQWRCNKRPSPRALRRVLAQRGASPLAEAALTGFTPRAKRALSEAYGVDLAWLAQEAGPRVTLLTPDLATLSREPDAHLDPARAAEARGGSRHGEGRSEGRAVG